MINDLCVKESEIPETSPSSDLEKGLSAFRTGDLAKAF